MNRRVGVMPTITMLQETAVLTTVAIGPIEMVMCNRHNRASIHRGSMETLHNREVATTAKARATIIRNHNKEAAHRHKAIMGAIPVEVEVIIAQAVEEDLTVPVAAVARTEVVEEDIKTILK